MLKHISPGRPGLDGQRLASSGRTSIPVDKDTPKRSTTASATGCAASGAIRVDILERLADLIPACRPGVKA
jgi:ATP-dependent RNA helicase SUPV3L1/SUV3